MVFIGVCVAQSLVFCTMSLQLFFIGVCVAQSFVFRSMFW